MKPEPKYELQIAQGKNEIRVDRANFMAMTKIIKRYSSILFNMLNGNYTLSLALASSIPEHLSFLGFLPKRITLSDGIKLVLNSPATLYYNIIGEYEWPEYTRFEEFVPRHGNIVFDVGAYVGIYTLRSAKKVGDNGRVYAFEPNPSPFIHLVSNVKINRIRNVSCFFTALGDRIGKTCFYTFDEKNINLESSSLFKSHLKKWNKGFTKTEVNMTTLDNVVKQLGLSRIDIAKIDVEGAEEIVLRGAKNTLSDGIIDKLIVEAHEYDIPSKKTVELISAFNYQVKHMARHPSGVKCIIYAKLAR